MNNAVLIGCGGIGAGVARGLLSGSVPGVELKGAIVRTPGRGAAAGIRELSFAEALERADLFIECAGGQAVREYGPEIIAAGKDLLLVSVGALADPDLRQVLIDRGPGRTFITNGAIGGLDLLAGVSQAGGLTELSLVTRKLPGTLVQPWMSGEEVARLQHARSAFTLFNGTVTEAIAWFPHSLNVAVALAHATNMWHETVVELIADPEAERVHHQITAAGQTGSYRFSIRNEPSQARATTSGVVVGSVLSGIRVLAGVSGSTV